MSVFRSNEKGETKSQAKKSKNEEDEDTSTFDTHLAGVDMPVDEWEGPEQQATYSNWVRPEPPAFDTKGEFLTFQQGELDHYVGQDRLDMPGANQGPAPVMRMFGVTMEGNTSDLSGVEKDEHLTEEASVMSSMVEIKEEVVDEVLNKEESFTYFDGKSNILSNDNYNWFKVGKKISTTILNNYFCSNTGCTAMKSAQRRKRVGFGGQPKPVWKVKYISPHSC